MLAVFAQTPCAAGLLEKAAVEHTCTQGGCTVRKLLWNGFSFVLVEAEYGKANWGAALGLAAQLYSIDAVLGVCLCSSAQRSEVKLLQIANGTKAVQYDVDFSALGCPVPLVPGLSQAQHFCDATFNRLTAQAARRLGYACYPAAFGSADRFASADAQAVCRRFALDCTDTLSGTLGALAAARGIAFAVFGCVCSNTGEQAGELYHIYSGAAGQRAGEVLCALLDQMAADAAPVTVQEAAVPHNWPESSASVEDDTFAEFEALPESFDTAPWPEDGFCDIPNAQPQAVPELADDAAPEAEPPLQDAPALAEDTAPEAEPSLQDAPALAEDTAPEAEPPLQNAPALAEDTAPEAEPPLQETAEDTPAQTFAGKLRPCFQARLENQWFEKAASTPSQARSAPWKSTTAVASPAKKPESVPAAPFFAKPAADPWKTVFSEAAAQPEQKTSAHPWLKSSR